MIIQVKITFIYLSNKLNKKPSFFVFHVIFYKYLVS